MAACRFSATTRALHSRRHEKGAAISKAGRPVRDANCDTGHSFLAWQAKGLNHAATDALSSCRLERHVRDAEGKVGTGLPLNGERLQDNRLIRSAGQRIGSRAGSTDSHPRGGA